MIISKENETVQKRRIIFQKIIRKNQLQIMFRQQRSFFKITTQNNYFQPNFLKQQRTNQNILHYPSLSDSYFNSNLQNDINRTNSNLYGSYISQNLYIQNSYFKSTLLPSEFYFQTNLFNPYFFSNIYLPLIQQFNESNKIMFKNKDREANDGKNKIINDNFQRNKKLLHNQDRKKFQEQNIIKQNAQILQQTQQYIVFDKLLGEGTYSKVYLGFTKKTKTKVAIKVVDKHDKNEIQQVFQLKHQNIAEIYNYWTKKNKLYIVIQLCQRNIKEDLIKHCYNEKIKIKYIKQIISVIDFLFKNGIIHRDLKLQNILVKKNKVKIADFGLARYNKHCFQIKSIRCGTPYTMAPEIFFSSQDKVFYSQKSDIWSLGIIFHQILYKIHPFDNNKQNFKHMKRVIVANKYSQLDKIINGCLQKINFRISWIQIIALFEKYLQEQQFRQQKFIQNLQVEKYIKPVLFQIESFQQEKHQAQQLLKSNYPQSFLKDEIQKQNFKQQKCRQNFNKNLIQNRNKADFKKIKNISNQNLQNFYYNEKQQKQIFSSIKKIKKQQYQKHLQQSFQFKLKQKQQFKQNNRKKIIYSTDKIQQLFPKKQTNWFQTIFLLCLMVFSLIYLIQCQRLKQ